MAITSNGFFSKALKGSNQLLLIANIALLAIALLTATVGAKTFYELVTGPKEVDASVFTELNATPDSFKRRHVTVKGSQIIDTGAGEITVRKKRGVERGRSETAHYYALEVNGKFLLVRGVTGAHTQPEISGWLIEPKSIDASTLSQLNAGPAKGELFTNVVLDETDTGGFEWFVTFLVLVAMGLSIWNIIKALGRSKNAAKFPAVAGVPVAARGDTNAFVAKVDEDLANSSKGPSGVRMGHAFALRHDKMKVDLLRFDQLIWAYQQVTKKKFYGIIPLGSSHAVKAFNDAGQAFEWHVGGKEDKALALLADFFDRAPAAIYGYSDELEVMWKKNRKGFAQLVAERKAQLAPQTAEGPATVPNAT